MSTQALTQVQQSNPPPQEVLGEITTRQDLLQVHGIFSTLPGLPAAPYGEFDTYREMRENPTIALARAVATCPLKSARWGFKLAKKAPDDGRAEFVEDVMTPLRNKLLREALFSLDYGFTVFEKVWTLRKGMVVYKKLKYLLPDITQIEVRDNGEYAGVYNTGTRLRAGKTALFSYDEEGGNWYGRPRHENIRKFAWPMWKDTADKFAKYMLKCAGVIPVIRYPPGEGKDAAGATKTHSTAAKEILEKLGTGAGVSFPNTLAKWAEDMLRKGADPKGLASWQIDFLASPTGTAGGEMINALKHCEALMLRGWFVPERAATEGQFGTKAEAGSHYDVALMMMEDTSQWLVDTINEQIINPLLVVNYGPGAEDTVKLEPEPLVDEIKALYRQIVLPYLTDANNADVLQTVLDLESMMDSLGLPVKPGGMQAALMAQQEAMQDPGLQAASQQLAAELGVEPQQATGMIKVAQEFHTRNLPPDAMLGLLGMAYPGTTPDVLQKVLDMASAPAPAPSLPPSGPGGPGGPPRGQGGPPRPRPKFGQGKEAETPEETLA